MVPLVAYSQDERGELELRAAVLPHLYIIYYILYIYLYSEWFLYNYATVLTHLKVDSFVEDGVPRDHLYGRLLLLDHPTGLHKECYQLQLQQIYHSER